MSLPTNAARNAPLDPAERVSPARPHPFYWSVRRELWENRSIYLAPLAVAAVVLLGFVIDASHLVRTRGVLALHIPIGSGPIELPYAIAAVLIVVCGLLVGAFYCLDALHGERRDRSILFWRSLPVGDTTAVLSKASIPLVVLPLVIFGAIVVTHLAMLLLNLAALVANGGSAAMLQPGTPLLELWLALLYALIAIALWYAPVYGWLLLVSAWARRAALLWASLPLIAICILEKIAFRTSYFAGFLRYRFWGWFAEALGSQRPCCIPHPLAIVLPGRFLSSAGLWIGLAMAAVLLAGASRVRRYRGPI